MTKFIGTPLRGIEFANPGDEAISSRVSGDTQPRLRIDAGGRITWSDGTNSGDTVLFRSDANALTTYDSLTASAGLITLTTNGIPSQSLPNGAIAIDTTNHVFYFRSNNEWLEVSGGATVTVSDTAPVGPEIGDLWYSSLELELFIYYSNAWIQLTDAQGGVQELYELSDVLIDDPLYGQTLVYNGTEWENDFILTAQSLQTARAISLAGDVSGSVAFDGSQNVSILATIQPNSVALGTDTTGSYINDLTAGTGVTITHTPGEGSSPTVAIGQAVGTSSSVQFAAVTAPLIGNSSTATTLENARTISLGGDVTGSVSFNGSSDVSISATIQPNSVALGADTTGNYMSGVSVQNGLTVSHTPGEGSSATIGVDNALLSNFLLDGASGNSYGLIGTSAYLDVKNTNGYNKEIELDIVALETKLTTDGYLKDSSTSASVSFAQLGTTGNLTVGGNLTVNGTTTTLNTETLAVEDNIVVLNSNVTGSPSTNAGIEVERGDSTNVSLRWNESTDKWETTTDGSAYSVIATNGNIALGTDTTGDYVSSLVAGTNISISGNSGEGATPTISVSASVSGVDSISSPDFIQFDTTANTTPVTGLLGWDSAQGTLNLGLSATKHIHIGEESLFRVRNATGTTIGKGTALYASGVEPSGRIQVTPYVADGTVREVRFMGLAAESIADGVNGFVQHFGHVRDLDTRGTSSTAISVGDETWAAGDILYVHPTVPGKLTNVAPRHAVVVALLIVRHQTTGWLFVRSSSGGHIEDIHDVVLTSPTDGQFLRYNSASTVWVNDAINLGTDTAGDYVQNLTAGTGVTLSNNSGEGATPTVEIGQDVSTSASVTFANVTATGNVAISGRIDKTTIRESVADASVSAGVVTANYATGDILYLGTAPSSNFTVNLTNAPTDNGKAITVVLFVTQGATGYYPSVVQVAGIEQEIKWANFTSPTPSSGNSGAIDIFSFTFVRRSSAWEVFGSSNLGYMGPQA